LVRVCVGEDANSAVEVRNLKEPPVWHLILKEGTSVSIHSAKKSDKQAEEKRREEKRVFVC
jgi:hypothetical protein